MASHESALTMQVLANEDLLALIMDYIGDPETLCNVVMALPVARTTFESCPRQLLTVSLSNLESESQLLAILYISLIQDDVSQASMIPLLWDYLRLDETAGIVEASAWAVDFALPQKFSDPFETLRKLAAVWSAVEGLACGFIEHSIQFIRNCRAAKDAGLETAYYDQGHKLRPLSHLWDRDIKLGGWPGFAILDKPQPWTLPLRASETDRVKRALWRLEVLAVVSHKPHTFPQENAIRSEAAKIHRTMPQGHDNGGCMLLASLCATELSELDSVYEFLLCETIGKAYLHKLDPYLPQSNTVVQQDYAERTGSTVSNNVESWKQTSDGFRAHFEMGKAAKLARAEHNNSLIYLMSLGLPFVHRVYQQIVRDGNDIIPEHYPNLKYRSIGGLQETWNKLGRSNTYNGRSLFDCKLVHSDVGISFTRRCPPIPLLPVDEPSSGRYGAYGAIYLLTRSSRDFRMEDLWRAGCYMWERRE